MFEAMRVMKRVFLNVCAKPAGRRAEQGFSLVELMVVIMIIGVLAGVAVPRFQAFRIRAAQTEGKSYLNSIYLGMQAFEANSGAYAIYTAASTPVRAFTSSGANIGFTAPGNSRYRFNMVSEVTRFAVFAVSTTKLGGATHDYLRINTNKFLCSTWDASINTAQSGCPQTTTAADAGVDTLAPVLANGDNPS